jgi:long-subunit acyl-CoA synthetase (AMP-forming)
VRTGDFTELLQFPMVLPRPKLSLDTLLTINFTSGTTGIPKGVVGRHRQAVAQILGVIGHL